MHSFSDAPAGPQAPFHATTVLGIIHNGQVALGADGQATMGNTVAKSKVTKIRELDEGQILAGFAGATADAFTLIEKFEEKLSAHGGILRRAAVELAKEWRTDRYLRHLEAMMIVMTADDALLVAGSGDVLEPEEGILAIGSGGNFALAAAHALKKHATNLTAEEMVREALTIAADICIYTNHNLTIKSLS